MLRPKLAPHRIPTLSSAAPRLHRRQALLGPASVPLLFLAVLLLGCSDTPTVRSIAITPALPRLALGTELQLAATATYSDDTTADVSSQAVWVSSNPAILSVDSAGNRGRLRGGARGVAVISATVDSLGGKVTGRITVEVSDAVLDFLSVTPAEPTLPVGVQLDLVATGTFTNRSTQNLTTQVRWVSDNPAVATVDDDAQKGRVRAVRQGTARVSATFGSRVHSVTLTITPAVLARIELTPVRPTLVAGTTQTFVATGVYTDSTTLDLSAQVSWASSNPRVATIGSAPAAPGLATALEVGQTTLSASFQGLTGSTLLTVRAAQPLGIELTPADLRLPRGLSRDFIAMVAFDNGTVQDLSAQVTWTSSIPTVAAISNAPGSRGRATALAPGQTTLSASFAGLTNSTPLTVTPEELARIDIRPGSATLARGRSLRFVATGVYTDNTTQDLSTQATWASSDPAVAAISNAEGSRGLTSALALGRTTITAAFGDLTGSATLDVTPEELVRLEVTPTTPSLPRGLTQDFVATGIYTDDTARDLSSQVSWSSSDRFVAEISNAQGSQGRATALRQGQTTITAALSTGFRTLFASTTLTVGPEELRAINIEPPSPTLPLRWNERLQATGLYTDNSARNLTATAVWTSSDPSVAVVSNAQGFRGLVTTLRPGQTTLTATLGDVSATTVLTVTTAQLVAIDVSPQSLILVPGEIDGFRATGRFDDGSTRSLDEQVAWTSTSPLVATVSGGYVYARDGGETRIEASVGALRGAATLTVLDAHLVSIAVTPSYVRLARGTTRVLQAIGTYSNGMTRDISDEVTWRSTDPASATISNAEGSRGLVTALAPSSGLYLNIEAIRDGVVGRGRLVVSAAQLTQLDITPTDSTLPAGFTRQFTATGHFSDGTTQDLSTQVTWQTSDEGVVSLSNLAGSQGRATGLVPGEATVTASFGGQSATLPLTVTSARLVALAITPPSALVYVGQTEPLTATGTFDDDSTVDLSAEVSWSSSNPRAASIDGRGLATALDNGETLITARAPGGIEATATLTIASSPPSYLSIVIAPRLPILAEGTLETFIATTIFPGSLQRDISDRVVWRSSNEAILRPEPQPGAPGAFLALAPGQALLTATLDRFSTVTLVTVVAAVPEPATP